MEILEDQAHDVVHRAVDGLLAEGAKAVGHVVGGAPAQAIMRIAQAEGADLIVVGNKGMRGVRRLLGSIPNAVSHGAGCDVLIVSTT
jgi:nucleotide-binding universal stress UspA family protein